MNNFLSISLFLALSLAFLHLSAQYKQFQDYSIGVFVGMSHYHGELSEPADAPQFTRPAIGLSISKELNPVISVRGTFTQGWITADDAKTSRRTAVIRNLNFNSPITEGSLQLVIDMAPQRGRSRRGPSMTPFLFGGVGFFAFNPKSEFRGQTVKLQPLGTEGQYLPDPNGEYPDPYKLFEPTFPLGFGLKFKLTPELNILVESGIRITFTDYLDDVSTNYPDLELLTSENPVAAAMSWRGSEIIVANGSKRGSSSLNDYYAFTGVTISYKLHFVRCPSF